MCFPRNFANMLNENFLEIFHVAWKFCKNFPCFIEKYMHACMHYCNMQNFHATPTRVANWINPVGTTSEHHN